MQAVKSLYGVERLNLEDLVDSKLNNPIELAYYKIKNKNQYAIEIVKTEHLEKKLNVESQKMNLLTDSETRTNYILEKLKRNKVTPIGLIDTITEIIKQENF
ncbi:MAG: hypothetical protein IKP28_06650 [Clostridia bacterium]|nr:hypothetical protein [Clostridia bacterium]